MQFIGNCAFNSLVLTKRFPTLVLFSGVQNSNARPASSTPVPGSQNPIAALFAEYSGCPQHRGLILSLSSILQIITIRCPGALIWHNLGEGKSNSILSGSPLDLLPCAPSSLPMPPGVDNQQVCRTISLSSHFRAQSIVNFSLFFRFGISSEPLKIRSLPVVAQLK